MRIFISLIILVIIALVACKEGEYSRPFFSKYHPVKNDKKVNTAIFYVKMDSIVKIKENISGYYFNSFFCFAEHDSRTLEGGNYERDIINGAIYKKNNSIFLKSNYMLSDIEILNFDLKINECKQINFWIKPSHGLYIYRKYEKKYYICLEDKFFDKSVHDTIYQFRLKDFGVYFIEDDAVLFVGKEVGIQGMFLGDMIFNDYNQKTESIYFHKSGNIYTNRPYFKNLSEKIIQ